MGDIHLKGTFKNNLLHEGEILDKQKLQKGSFVWENENYVLENGEFVNLADNTTQIVKNKLPYPFLDDEETYFLGLTKDNIPIKGKLVFKKLNIEFNGTITMFEAQKFSGEGELKDSDSTQKGKLINNMLTGDGIILFKNQTLKGKFQSGILINGEIVDDTQKRTGEFQKILHHEYLLTKGVFTKNNFSQEGEFTEKGFRRGTQKKDKIEEEGEFEDGILIKGTRKDEFGVKKGEFEGGNLKKGSF